MQLDWHSCGAWRNRPESSFQKIRPSWTSQLRTRQLSSAASLIIAGLAQVASLVSGRLRSFRSIEDSVLDFSFSFFFTTSTNKGLPRRLQSRPHPRVLTRSRHRRPGSNRVAIAVRILGTREVKPPDLSPACPQ